MDGESSNQRGSYRELPETVAEGKGTGRGGGEQPGWGGTCLVGEALT